MADLAGVMRTYILGDAAIAALLGSRFYPAPAAESAVPYVTYQQVSGPHLGSLEGPTGIERPRLQLTVWSASRLEANDLARLIITRMGGFRGTWTGETIQGVHTIDEDDVQEPSPEADAQRRYGRRIDFEIWHRAT